MESAPPRQNRPELLDPQLPKVETMLRQAADDVTALAYFPVSHWRPRPANGGIM